MSRAGWVLSPLAADLLSVASAAHKPVSEFKTGLERRRNEEIQTTDWAINVTLSALEHAGLLSGQSASGVRLYSLTAHGEHWNGALRRCTRVAAPVAHTSAYLRELAMNGYLHDSPPARAADGRARRTGNAGSAA